MEISEQGRKRLTTDDLIAETEKRLHLFESNLPHRIDPLSLSRSKLPFKALSYREALFWRVTELGRTAFDNLKADRLAAAIILARAVTETTAALWYLSKKLKITLAAGSVGDVDHYLMRLSLGTRNRKAENIPEAINVMTFIQCAAKTFEGIEENYAMLCEYAHPNWAGAVGLYCRNDYEEILTDLGPNANSLENGKFICALNLSTALMVFENAYEKIGDLMPSFIALCESCLSPLTPETTV